MNRRGRIGAAGLLIALGLAAAGAVAAQVRPTTDRPIPDRPPPGAPDARPAGPVAPTRPPGLPPISPAVKKPDLPGSAGQVCVVAYEDRNANGRRDPGEGPLLGQRFTVANTAGATLAQGVTAADGRFCTPRNLPLGDYRVRQIPGAGLTNTDPGAASPNLRTVTLRADGTATALFGSCRGAGCAGGAAAKPRGGPDRPQAPPISRSGSVCILKYEDLDQSAGYTNGENFLSGWTFTVTNNATGATYSGATVGGWYCPQLPPGVYTVTETQQPGWINTEPGSSSLSQTVTVSSANETLHFGNYKLPPSETKVCIEKYHDKNGDGTRDPGEPPLSGFNFNLSIGFWGQTAADGRICWPMTPGNFVATEDNKPNWINSDPGGLSAKKPFTVAPGETTTVLFGNYPVPGTVCITKYDDQDNSGARNGGEAGLPGWTFKLETSGGAPVATVTTAGVAGSVCRKMEPGAYIAREVAKPGWTNTDPPGSSPHKPFTIASNQTIDLVFGNRVTPPAPGKVCVTKYDDRNGNGSRDAGEPGLPGWTFTVAIPGTGAVTTLTTYGSAGQACTQAVLPPGSYTLTESLPTGGGWVNTDPGGIAIKSFTLAAGGTENLAFGNVRLGRVCVRKYNDANNNGAWTSPEPMMQGVGFTVKNGAGQVVASGVTDVFGAYCTPFALPPGSYAVAETVPIGWTNTQPGGAASVVVAMPVPGSTAQLWFGNHKNPPPPQPGELCVEKYNDLNGDGDQDPGEAPLQGWTFTRSGGGMPTLSGSTNANGRWCPGTMLPPGNYTVAETMKAGWTSTDPGGSSPSKMALVVTNQTTIVKFGNLQAPLPGEICVQKYNDLNSNGSRDSGEPPLANWQFTVRNASNIVVGQGSTGANGRWCMSAMAPPGTYTVTETPRTGWGNTDPVGLPVKTVVVGANATVTVWFGNRAL